MAGKRKTPTRRKVAPVQTVRKPHPEAWKLALKYAGGDKDRLSVDENGAVTAWNSPEVAQAH